MADLVVADASPLIVLARIGHLQTLEQVAGAVVVPDAVAGECIGDLRKAGAARIEQAFAAGWLKRQPPLPRATAIEVGGLGPGEREATGLAEALRATILIDERPGRSVARGRGIPVVGTLGILLRARDDGIIESIDAAIADMKSIGFFITPALEQEVLRRARIDPSRRSI